MWHMPWAVLQRIMIDGPKYSATSMDDKKKDAPLLTAESAAEIMAKAKRQ